MSFSHSPAPAARLPRIAMVISGDVFGGAERQLLTLCKAGESLFEAVIFQTLPGPFSGLAQKEGLCCRRILEGKSLALSGKLLAETLKAERFDLIHTHGYRSAAIAALAIARGKRLPVVRTLHGAPEMFKSAKMGVYEIIGRLAGGYSLAHNVYVSRELVTKMHGPRSATVIYNGVDTQMPVGEKPLELGSAKTNLVAVGRLEPVKGLNFLIEAMVHPVIQARAQLHLVGDGPDRQMLTDLVAKLGLQEVVKFHGFRSDVLSFIKHSDMLMLPSLHEGVPYVLLEALALGTPVIASDVGGIPEVVRHRQDAWLMSPGDALEITRALRRVLPDKELREGLAKQGLTRITELFSGEVMAREYAALYRRKIANR